jgi:hypothetical protein
MAGMGAALGGSHGGAGPAGDKQEADDDDERRLAAHSREAPSPAAWAAPRRPCAQLRSANRAGCLAPLGRTARAPRATVA